MGKLGNNKQALMGGANNIEDSLPEYDGEAGLGGNDS